MACRHWIKSKRRETFKKVQNFDFLSHSVGISPRISDNQDTFSRTLSLIQSNRPGSMCHHFYIATFSFLIVDATEKASEIIVTTVHFPSLADTDDEEC
jgi:hypothetical protein